MGILYIVSTPIGNLADISYRAVEALGTADRVLAEDTRHTAILFRHYGIRTRLYSAHEHNEQSRVEQVLSWLDDGESVALVSDAGTPLISDPGARIVHTVIKRGHQVLPIPGASSVLAALVGSGLNP
ncbi:MAG: ribosomal RNA small subunit methyltransferase I, partial [Gemmatimonadota bacterium]